MREVMYTGAHARYHLEAGEGGKEDAKKSNNGKKRLSSHTLERDLHHGAKEESALDESLTAAEYRPQRLYHRLIGRGLPAPSFLLALSVRGHRSGGHRQSRGDDARLQTG